MTSQQKSELRQAMKAVVQGLPADARVAASQAICATLAALPELVAARVVLAYLPMAREVDVLPLARDLLRAGVVVAVPELAVEEGERAEVVENPQRHGGSMHAVAVDSLEDDALVAGPMGVRAPRRGRRLAIGSIGVVLVPGLGFDPQGHRLGRGGGYYDRFLARRAPTSLAVGVCFDQQLIERVPVEPHDASVDMVLTDRRVVYTRRADAANSTMDG